MSADVHYRGHVISYDPPPIPIRNCDWQATDPNLDGTITGNGATLDECKAAVDAWIEENEDA